MKAAASGGMGTDVHLKFLSEWTPLPHKKSVLQKILFAKQAPNHNTQAKKTPKTHASGSPLPPHPHGVARPYAIILWRTPAKLAGVIDLPLLDTSVEAHRLIFIIFNE
jgi:hypothetical protein